MARNSTKKLFPFALALFLLMGFWPLGGCGPLAVPQALQIVQDAEITCPDFTENRCALPSELQELADETMREIPGREPLHYACLLDIGEDALLARLHLIRAAKSSILLQTYIWDDDEVGQLVFKELLDAARRGVKVQMIFDQYGSYVTARVMAAMETAHENIEIKFYRPIMRRGGKSLTHDIGSIVTDMRTLHRRMHNKILVIDERIGIAGGRNIQDSYYDYGNRFNFKDLDVLVIGPEVGDMATSFEMYWESPKTKSVLELYDIAMAALRLKKSDRTSLYDSKQLSKLAKISEQANAYSIVQSSDTLNLFAVDRVEYVADRPDKKRKKTEGKQWDSTSRLREILLQAEESIQLETPYLIQNFKAIRTLKQFVKWNPDVEIKLCTNSLASTDKFYVWALIFKQRQFYLKTLGSQIFEFKPIPGQASLFMPRFAQVTAEPSDEIDLNENEKLSVALEDYQGPRLCLHSKFFIVDQHISAIGSHNFDPRGKNLNTESMVIIWDDELAQDLSRIFKRDTNPQNSWVVARRERPLNHLNAFFAGISSSLPIFDLWPFDYSSNYELRDNRQSVPSNHPDFYKNYKSVGVFPEVGLSKDRLGVRLIKGFGGILRGLM